MKSQNNIRKFRKKVGLTQTDLADALNINRATISKYETGDIELPIQQARKIAKVLGISWTDLYTSEAQQGQAIIDHMKEKLRNGEPLKKISIDEARKPGIVSLAFNSDGDRIAYFYSLLNTDGKLIASKHFYQHLDKNSISDVADYVERLSEIPQYQRKPQEGDENAVDKEKDD